MKTKEQKQYKITYVGDLSLNNIHHIGMECNGNYYSVIFGEYVNGEFCCIPNWNISCELADLDNISWNTESICKIIHNEDVARNIAGMIAEVAKKLGKR